MVLASAISQEKETKALMIIKKEVKILLFFRWYNYVVEYKVHFINYFSEEFQCFINYYPEFNIYLRT